MLIDLTSVGSWLTRNRLRLKSNCMVFGRLGLINTFDLPFGDQAVTKSTLVKYLGIYIDPVLSFKAHIGAVVRKFSCINSEEGYSSYLWCAIQGPNLFFL
jgi:hypothetical protein